MMGVPVHINIEDSQFELDAYLLVAQRRGIARASCSVSAAPCAACCRTPWRASAQRDRSALPRLVGADIARRDHREGRVPLHTLRRDIDYATAEANTTYGVIGVKVWIFKGEVIGQKEDEKAAVLAPDSRPCGKR